MTTIPTGTLMKKIHDQFRPLVSAPPSPQWLSTRATDNAADVRRDRDAFASPSPVVRRRSVLGEERRARFGWQGVCELGARVDAELGEDLAEVVLDGVLADEEPRADFRVGEAVAGE